MCSAYMSMYTHSYKSKWEPFLVHDYDKSVLFEDETIWNVKLRGIKLNTQNGLKYQRYEILHLVKYLINICSKNRSTCLLRIQ